MNEFERLDDLQIGGLSIIQDTREFCFGIDAVLLAAFADVHRGDAVLDLCTGTGIIPLLLSVKTEAAEICGLEIRAEAASLARRSVLYNQIKTVEIITGDLKDHAAIFGTRRFDYITCNPPYIPCGGLQNPNDALAIARHELLCDLNDVLSAASQRLQYGGKLAMVHRADRLTDILATMREKKIEPKRLRTVHSKQDKAATLILIEGILGGGKALHVMPPLVIYKKDGTYTNEVLSMYGKETL